MTTAWHGDAALKEEVLTRLWAHRAADTIVRGLYQQYAPRFATGYRGCAIGCTLPLQEPEPCNCPAFHDVAEPGAGWHGQVETLYGIPMRVAKIIDEIFESTAPHAAAGDFAVAVIEAIPVGADLSQVASRWADGDEAEGPVDDAGLLIHLLATAPVPAATS
jgi:hypothetical protein